MLPRYWQIFKVYRQLTCQNNQKRDYNPHAGLADARLHRISAGIRDRHRLLPDRGVHPSRIVMAQGGEQRGREAGAWLGLRVRRR